MCDTLDLFLQGVLEGASFTLTPVAGDASFRSYKRVETAHGGFILMDAPPDKEDSSPFVDIARFLKQFNIPVPAVLHTQLERGYLLLEDFGDMTFLKAMAQSMGSGAMPLQVMPPQNPQIQHTINTMYHAAVATLLDIQATPVDGSCVAHQRFFDRNMLRRELALFTDWYIEKNQERVIHDEDRQQFEALFSTLLDEILRQPVVFVHRDYHSRNLMWHHGRVGVLDFQDAVMGPITYDLASLLRDCYVAWSAPFRRQIMALWLEGARLRLGYEPESWQAFQKAFDWMAIQRNLKAIGIFSRLSHRDGKHGYLEDIPRTMGYVREVLVHYSELRALEYLLDRYTPPL